MKVNYKTQELLLLVKLGAAYNDIIPTVVSRWYTDYETIMLRVFHSCGYMFHDAYTTQYRNPSESRPRAIALACNAIVSRVACEMVRGIDHKLTYHEENRAIDATLDWLKSTLSSQTIEGAFQLYTHLRDSGKVIPDQEPKHRKPFIFKDPSMLFKRVQVLNDLNIKELAGMLNSRSRQHMSDVVYGYAYPSASELILLCLKFEQSLADWMAASPCVDTIITQYEKDTKRSISDLTAEFADKYGVQYTEVLQRSTL